MTTAKTFYTDQELTKRSTAQLIAIYNRLFNDNAWDTWFNPFEHRMEIWMALWTEMRAQEVAALLTPEDYAAEPYKAMKIVVSEQGMAVVWNTGEMKPSHRRFTDAQAQLVRELAADGETQKWIALAVGVSFKNVFDILSGRYALTANRWNTDAETQQRKSVRKARNFTAARAAKCETVYVERSSLFWAQYGL